MLASTLPARWLLTSTATSTTTTGSTSTWTHSTPSTSSAVQEAEGTEAGSSPIRCPSSISNIGDGDSRTQASCEALSLSLPTLLILFHTYRPRPSHGLHLARYWIVLASLFLDSLPPAAIGCSRRIDKGSVDGGGHVLQPLDQQLPRAGGSRRTSKRETELTSSRLQWPNNLVPIDVEGGEVGWSRGANVDQWAVVYANIVRPSRLLVWHFSLYGR
jgi:hypothetical protein